MNDHAGPVVIVGAALAGVSIWIFRDSYRELLSSIEARVAGLAEVGEYARG